MVKAALAVEFSERERKALDLIRNLLQAYGGLWFLQGSFNREVVTTNYIIAVEALARRYALELANLKEGS